MITKEINDLFTDLVRAKLFLPNADGVRTFARLLAQINMKQAGKPRLYGERTVVGQRKKIKKKWNGRTYEILPRS